MALYLRVFQHLLPDAAAWRTLTQKTLRKFFEGLERPYSDFRDFLDLIWADLFPDTTRELATWESQFGLEPIGAVATRRLAVAAEWMAQGGQSPRYLQNTVQAAGFDLYLHEWWDPNGNDWLQVQCGDDLAQCGEPLAQCAESTFRPVRDPRDYTNVPLIGVTQCGDDLAQCGEPDAYCSDLLVNEPGYIVNLDLTRRAPPVVPNDPQAWHYFLYWGGETFGDRVEISSAERTRLERLVKKICPTQNWLVMLVDYT